MKIAPEELIIQITTPIYIFLIGLEILLSNWQHKKFYAVKDTIMNVVMMLLNGSIDLLFRVVYVGVLLWVYNHRLTEAISNSYLYWFVLFILEDLAFYTLHYIDHTSRLFWAVHVTHHSSEHFNLTTGFRSSVFQPLYRFVYFIPVAALGFNPADILIMYSITQIYGILVHTRYINKMGFLEHFLVTPSHHRVHHASNAVYLDKNMGMCLIIWDKIFGTFQPELDSVKIEYGLTTQLKDTGVINTVFHEWKAIFSDFVNQKVDFGTKLKYVFNPPGWSHDGSRKTSKELQAEIKNLR